MSTGFCCWRCGAALAGMILPVSRRETCGACDAEIHVCRMCVHFRPGRRVACGEERAEDVSDRERANFCDYFAASENAFRAPDDLAVDAARQRLDALFSETPEQASPAPADADRDALEALFSPPPGSDDGNSS